EWLRAGRTVGRGKSDVIETLPGGRALIRLRVVDDHEPSALRLQCLAPIPLESVLDHAALGQTQVLLVVALESHDAVFLQPFGGVVHQLPVSDQVLAVLVDLLDQTQHSLSTIHHDSLRGPAPGRAVGQKWSKAGSRLA